MQTNLSRTGQMAISNDQITNPLRLLKAKLKNGDTWQQGTNFQGDSYPQTQPVKPSQSPLYPKSDYDFYTMKQQQTNSQPKISDPRTLNYQQLQQYKQQQPPPTQITKNDPYLGMNAMNRLNYYDQMQKYKQQEDPYKKNNPNPQSYYDQQQNKKLQPQQPQKYYDDILKQPLSYNNNYEFSQNKYDFTQNNNPLYQQQNYNNNNFSWGLNNNTKQANYYAQPQNNYPQSNNIYPQNNNNYQQNNYGFSNYAQQQLSNYGQTQQQQQFSNYQLNQPQQQQKNYNKYDDNYNQQQYNQQNNNLYNQQTQSTSPFKQQSQQQQFKQSQHNSQPTFERRDRQLDRQNEQQIKQEQPIRKPLPPPQQNKNYLNPIDELPAVAKKNPNNQFPPEEDDADLVDCPEGCGRRFKEDALDKHVKVCKKVFQSKRKEFNSKAHRQVNQEQQKLEKLGQVKDKIIEKKKQMASNNGDPKWKKQSEAFRQMIKAAKTGDTVEIQQPDDLVECPGCGRKFNESAAERHIPGCKKRNQKR